MVIIKIISQQFIPFGIYARKIINFLIAEFTYKKNYPGIYETEISQRMVCLGRKPLDFVEKICGTRKVGSNTRKSILKQLEAILNCHMAIATGYKQMNPKDDELLAEDRYQFALIEAQNNELLINHNFNISENWQEEIYVSKDLAKILSQHIMPLDSRVYNQISSPMELDIYQYFTYQNHNNVKRGIGELKYDWGEMMRLFGRGYTNDSKGLGNFRRDFRNCVIELQTKTPLAISAPINSKQITFKPNKILTLNNAATKAKSWKEIEYEVYKPIIDTLPVIGESAIPKAIIDWQSVIKKYNLISKFDNNALNFIKTAFNKDAVHTVKTIEYVLEQRPQKPSAFIKKALTDNWVKKHEMFTQKLLNLRTTYSNISSDETANYIRMAGQAVEFLRSRYYPEDFSLDTLTLIYTGLCNSVNHELFLCELEGSKYQTYFKRHAELLACLDDTVLPNLKKGH